MTRVEIKCTNCQHEWKGKHPDDRTGYGSPVCGECGCRAGKVESDEREQESEDTDPNEGEGGEPTEVTSDDLTPENDEMTEIDTEDKTTGKDVNSDENDENADEKPVENKETKNDENSVQTVAGALSYEDSETETIPSGLTISEVQGPEGNRMSVSTSENDVIVKAEGRSFLIDETEKAGYMVVQP